MATFSLPDTERAADPIASSHEQHRLLLSAQLAHGDRRHRLGPPARILKVEGAEPAAGNNQQEVIWTRLGDLPRKQHTISAEGNDEVTAFEGLADCAIRKLRIEISNPVKPKQSGHNPVAPHLVSTAHTCGIEVGGASGVAVAILGIAAETRPPITAESQDLDQHYSGTPSVRD